MYDILNYNFKTELEKLITHKGGGKSKKQKGGTSNKDLVDAVNNFYNLFQFEDDNKKTMDYIAMVEELFTTPDSEIQSPSIDSTETAIEKKEEELTPELTPQNTLEDDKPDDEPSEPHESYKKGGKKKTKKKRKKKRKTLKIKRKDLKTKP